MTPEDELRLLREGPRPDEKPPAPGTEQVIAAGPAEQIIQRATEVLRVVDEHTASWPDLDGWRSLLPSWFVAAAAPERTAEEEAAEQERIRRLPPAELADAAASRQWPLSSWLYWLEPAQRQWYWWSATAPAADTALVTIWIAGWPAPLGALDWLLRAAGATSVDHDD
jgi:hypothetical protein